MMTYYEAKFAREAQANPTDWVIYPIMVNGAPTDRHRLVYIGPAPDAEPRTEATIGAETKVRYLRVVK